jgi:UPF0755 protein
MGRVLVGLVVIAAVVAAFYGLAPYGTPQSWTGGETFVEIAPGTGTAGIARQLEQAHVLRSRYVLEAMKLVRGGTLKAGEYRFDHPETPAEVYDRLRRGDVFTVSVVIPEGFNIFDVASAVAAAGLAPRDTFLLAEMQHTELIARWSPHATSLEGYLFPDTYRFSRHATPEQMLVVMVKRFAQQAARLGLVASTPASPGARDPEHPASSHPAYDDDGAVVMNGPPRDLAEVVTMASLIEKEVHVDAERARVASVFENRLAAGMPLQTDPAVIYASLLRGTWTGVIHQSELHSDSAYNTYAHKGLPPGPICNPGLAAMQAAMHPAKTDYLYFVADTKGATRFAATLAEHNANVAAYRAMTGR